MLYCLIPLPRLLALLELFEQYSTGDREFVEYAVTSKGTDIFHTSSNVSTGVNLFNTAFDFTAGGEVKIAYTLDANLSTGDDVEITVVSQIIKSRGKKVTMPVSNKTFDSVGGFSIAK